MHCGGPSGIPSILLRNRAPLLRLLSVLRIVNALYPAVSMLCIDAQRTHWTAVLGSWHSEVRFRSMLKMHTMSSLWTALLWLCYLWGSDSMGPLFAWQTAGPLTLPLLGSPQPGALRAWAHHTAQAKGVWNTLAVPHLLWSAGRVACKVVPRTHTRGGWQLPEPGLS